MKIVVFGTGLFYDNRKQELKEICPDGEIIAFLDNNKNIREKDGIVVVNPEKIKEINYDQIILMSKSSSEMKKQLLSLGIAREQILSWDDVLDTRRGTEIRYYGNSIKEGKKHRLLIISPGLGYSGVPIVSSYIAKVLGEQDFDVTLASTGGDYHFIQEMNDSGINIVIYPKLERGGKVEKSWISQFDYIIVNSFVMIESVEYISQFRPVIWWLHEASNYVERTLSENPYSISSINMDNVDIFAVSSVAKENVRNVLASDKIKILPYGIPEAGNEALSNDENEKIVFAIIGTIEKRKAQDIFINAAKHIDSNKAEFWIIGATIDETIYNEIKKTSHEYKNIKNLGELSRREMADAYKHMDVLVCPSREDPFPVTITEALMYGKTVIVSDNVGQAEYIQNGINGYICKSGNEESLVEKMQEVIANKKSLKTIGQSARKLYESKFTLESFAQNLQEIILPKKQD